MNKPISTYLAYGSFAVAVAVWAAVGYFGSTVQGEQSAYLGRIIEAGEQAQKVAANARLHVLATNHKDNALRIDAYMAPDASMIIDSIKSVGTAAGVPVKISSALPGVVPKNQKNLHAVVFLIESTGSLDSLMRALALFDALPLPSSVESVDLSEEENQSGRTAKTWRMNARIRVFTTEAVSS
ncbi:hypothetical protein FJY93_00865 [Candidatus Kaiserbacteria bacterium]|nr:hypothetical protein [Candidatus Kaiserbacteria bacterium]